MSDDKRVLQKEGIVIFRDPTGNMSYRYEFSGMTQVDKTHVLAFLEICKEAVLGDLKKGYGSFTKEDLEQED